MVLKLYECRRYKTHDLSWCGALIIKAHNHEEARIIFRDKEGELPEEIIELRVKGCGVLYNDWER